MPLKYVFIEALASMRNRIYKSIFGLTYMLDELEELEMVAEDDLNANDLKLEELETVVVIMVDVSPLWAASAAPKSQ